jgi:hypothetical protein
MKAVAFGVLDVHRRFSPTFFRIFFSVSTTHMVVLKGHPIIVAIFNTFSRVFAIDIFFIVFFYCNELAYPRVIYIIFSIFSGEEEEATGVLKIRRLSTWTALNLTLYDLDSSFVLAPGYHVQSLLTIFEVSEAVSENSASWYMNRSSRITFEDGNEDSM